MAFKYRERPADALEKRADAPSGDFQGFILDEFKTYSPKKGDNWIRILPPTWDDPKHYGLDISVHYGIGPDRASAICIAKQPHPLNGGVSHCPICEARVRAEREGDEEFAKELKPSKRILVWLLDRREDDKGPLLWAMPWSLDKDLISASRDKRTGESFEIDHPDHGYDISFEKEGEQLKTKYNGIQRTQRSSSVDQAHLDYIEGAPLPFVMRWRDYAELKILFDGGAEPAPKRREPEPEQRRRDPEPEQRRRDPAPEQRRRDPEPEPAPRRRDPDPEPEQRRRDPEPEPAPRRRDPDPESNYDRNADLDDRPATRRDSEPAPRRREPEPEPEPREQAQAPASTNARADALRARYAAKK